MRPFVLAVAAAVVAALAVPSLRAQSLAEIAERNRKKAEKKPAKVYTEDDLRGRPAASGSMSQMEGPDAVVAPNAVASPAAGAAAAGEKPKTEEEERASREADWRDRLAKANEEVTRIQGEVDRAQTALNDITGPLYGGTRAGLINRVEQGQRQLAAAKKAVEDLQEEGRRARFR